MKVTKIMQKSLHIVQCITNLQEKSKYKEKEYQYYS